MAYGSGDMKWLEGFDRSMGTPSFSNLLKFRCTCRTGGDGGGLLPRLPALTILT